MSAKGTVKPSDNPIVASEMILGSTRKEEDELPESLFSVDSELSETSEAMDAESQDP